MDHFRIEAPSGAYGVTPVAPVGDAPSEAQIAADAGFYLGYLAELSNNYSGSNPDPSALAEIQRIVSKYLGAGGYLSAVTDPTMKALIQNAMNILAPGGTVTTASAAAFYAAYTAPTDPITQPDIAMQVWNWFAPTDGKTPPGFSFNDMSGDKASDEETTFAFTMFLTASDLGGLSSGALGARLNQFMGNGDGPAPTWYWAGDFLAGYAYTQDPSGKLGKLISNIMPPNPSKSQPNYHQFLDFFDSSYAAWSSSGHSLDGDYTWLLYVLQHPQGK